MSLIPYLPVFTVPDGPLAAPIYVATNGTGITRSRWFCTVTMLAGHWAARGKGDKSPGGR